MTVAVGVELDDSVDDDVAVLVRDCELLGVPLRVAELLGVPERVSELLEVPVVLGVADGLRVPDDEPVMERVEEDVCDAVGVAVCVDIGLSV